MFFRTKGILLVLGLFSGVDCFSDGPTFVDPVGQALPVLPKHNKADASVQADSAGQGESIASFQREVRQANRFFRAILEVCGARDLARIKPPQRREALDFLLKIQNYVPGSSAKFDVFWQLAQEEYNSHLAAFYAKMGRIVAGSDHEELDRRELAISFVKAFFDSLLEYDGPKPKSFNPICNRVRTIFLKKILWINKASAAYLKQLVMKNSSAIKFGIVCAAAATALVAYIGKNSFNKVAQESEETLLQTKGAALEARIFFASFNGHVCDPKTGERIIGPSEIPGMQYLVEQLLLAWTKLPDSAKADMKELGVKFCSVLQKCDTQIANILYFGMGPAGCLVRPTPGAPPPVCAQGPGESNTAVFRAAPVDAQTGEASAIQGPGPDLTFFGSEKPPRTSPPPGSNAASRPPPSPLATPAQPQGWGQMAASLWARVPAWPFRIERPY